jgi:hypothetical protein
LLRDYHAAIFELVISVLMALELRNALGARARDWLRHRDCARLRYSRHDWL